MKALKEASCSEDTKSWAKGRKIGSIWHIYRPQDADKIRNFLTKVRSIFANQRYSCCKIPSNYKADKIEIAAPQILLQTLPLHGSKLT